MYGFAGGGEGSWVGWIARRADGFELMGSRGRVSTEAAEEARLRRPLDEVNIVIDVVATALNIYVIICTESILRGFRFPPLTDSGLTR